MRYSPYTDRSYNRNSSSSSGNVNAKLGGAGAILLLVFVFLGPCIYRSTAEEITITVAEKERVTQNTSEGVSSKYIVSTKEGEVFEVTDSMSYMNCRASDRYFRLKPGRTYRCKVAGWRIGCASSYRNIIEAHEVEQ